MRIVIQRVSEAFLAIDGETVASIGEGFLALVGICEEDDEAIALRMIKKLLGLRIMSDSQGKTNLSLADVSGELLLVSQFTLYADCHKGNRPSFFRAGDPEKAEALYDFVVEQCRIQAPASVRVSSGVFGADMKIRLLNDGPFTVILDSEEMWGSRASDL